MQDFGNVKRKKNPLKLKIILKVSVMSLMKSTSVVKNAKKKKNDNISQKNTLLETETKSEICKIKAENEHVYKN